MKRNVGMELIEAAVMFCAADRRLSEIRKTLRRCSNCEPADYRDGYPGNPPCDPPTLDAGTGEWDTEGICDECKHRFASEPARKAAMKDRRSAKAKMLRAYRKQVAA